MNKRSLARRDTGATAPPFIQTVILPPFGDKRQKVAEGLLAFIKFLFILGGNLASCVPSMDCSVSVLNTPKVQHRGRHQLCSVHPRLREYFSLSHSCWVPRAPLLGAVPRARLRGHDAEFPAICIFPVLVGRQPGLCCKLYFLIH